MEYVIPVTTTGSNGVATGTGDSGTAIEGFITDVFVDYDPSAPATTVVAVAELEGTARTILSLAASNTDIAKCPRALLHDTSGNSLGQYGLIYIPNRKVRVTVTLSNALSPAVVVRVLVA